MVGEGEADVDVDVVDGVDALWKPACAGLGAMKKGYGGSMCVCLGRMAGIESNGAIMGIGADAIGEACARSAFFALVEERCCCKT
jgi:hypothetical protein